MRSSTPLFRPIVKKLQRVFEAGDFVGEILAVRQENGIRERPLIHRMTLQVKRVFRLGGHASAHYGRGSIQYAG